MEPLTGQIHAERKIAKEKEKEEIDGKRNSCYKLFLETISKNRESIKQTFIDNPETQCVSVVYDNNYGCTRYFKEPVVIPGESMTVRPICRRIDEGYGFFSYQDVLSVCLVEKQESFFKKVVTSLGYSGS